ncbi:MAG: TolC family outer membrane protein [Burkholderiales bacterium]|nr:TolC family outer membrane protein [Burkholderiales bacterium]
MKRCAIFSVLLAFSQPLLAADLLQTYREARANDPVYAAAQAARDAGRENLPQGLAALLPVIGVSGYTQMNNLDIDYRGVLQSSYRSGNTNGYSVSLTQPLFNWQSIMLYKEAGFKVAQSEAAFGQVAQDLILRVAQAYFDVLASQDTLAFIQAQKIAISEQLAQAKRNFEVGTATITDTHEAQARFDLSVSQEIAAQSDLEIKKSALQQIIGKFPERLAPLKPTTEIEMPSPSALEPWVASAEDQNFGVRVQQAALEIATREIERSRSGHYPTLNLVGSYGTSSSSFSPAGALVNAPSDSTSSVVGLQFAIPLYSGGGVSSVVRQSIANQERSRQDLETARRAAAQGVRQAYLGFHNGIAQVRALEQALISSQSALDSNKLGYEVGVRINIDVLNAQQQLYSTKRDLSKARYDTLLSGLKLKAAAGSLTEEDVQTVNRLLGSN